MNDKTIRSASWPLLKTDYMNYIIKYYHPTIPRIYLDQYISLSKRPELFIKYKKNVNLKRYKTT